VGPGCVLFPTIDPLRFLAGCHRRRLGGLVVALGFFSLLDRACFCVIFSVYGCMLCLVRYLFVSSTSVIDCLGRSVPEMTYYVLSGTLNLAQLNSTDKGCWVRLKYYDVIKICIIIITIIIKTAEGQGSRSNVAKI